MSNFRKNIINRVAGSQAFALENVLSRNNSYILADVDLDKKEKFLEDYHNNVGQRLEDTNVIDYRKPNDLRKGKKQLRVFFNASDPDIEQLKSAEIFPKLLAGSEANKAGKTVKDFKWVINDTPLLFQILRDGGFKLGLNKNYNPLLHETSKEKDLEKEYYNIVNKLEQIDLSSLEAQKLKKDKDNILESLRKLESKRLAPTAKSVMRRIRLAEIVLSEANLNMDLNRALEIFPSINREGFHVILFVLMMKAYQDNYEKLASAFPETAKVLEKYKKFGFQSDDSEIVIGPNFK